jgi:hypothetical protein
MTTNYVDAFISISPDSSASESTEPKAGTVAAAHLRLLREKPYGYTSDELLFTVHAERAGIAESDQQQAWQEFRAKPTACLRASALVRSYGWGLHHDGQSKVAAYGVETDSYRDFLARKDLKQTYGMRKRRA